MYALIYDVFSSEEELDAKINAALAKYVHDLNANKYIETIRNTKGKLCATYMQFVYSYGHTTMQVGKWFNNHLKVHGDLKKYLSVANLIMLYNLVDRLARNQDFESIKRPVKLRKENKRWSQHCQDHLDDFMIKSATEVIYCVVPSDDLCKFSHKCGKESTVKFSTNIVHLGKS